MKRSWLLECPACGGDKQSIDFISAKYADDVSTIGNQVSIVTVGHCQQGRIPRSQGRRYDPKHPEYGIRPIWGPIGSAVRGYLSRNRVIVVRNP